MTLEIDRMPMTPDDPGACPPQFAIPREPLARTAKELEADKAMERERRRAHAERMRERTIAARGEIKRIGEACHQCSVVEDSPDADDCPFIKLCPGKHRRQIRAKTAKCHVGRWVVDVSRFCGQVRQDNPVVDDGCSSLQMRYMSRQGFS